MPFKNTALNPLPRILDSITVWGYPAIGGSTITVSSGFVSGFDLKRDGKDTKVKFIKTDTVINPGNSGGASFDSHFYFIGIPSNAYPGQLGFLIPMETIIGWLESLDRESSIQLRDIESIGTYKKSFPDIRDGDALQETAGLLRYLKIMVGYADGTFGPDAALTRAETAAIIVAASRAKLPKSVASCAPGLNMNAWYAASMCHAIGKGWITERMSEDFSAAITEDEFVEIFNRAFPESNLKSFSRNSVSRRAAANAIFSLLAP